MSSFDNIYNEVGLNGQFLKTKSPKIQMFVITCGLREYLIQKIIENAQGLKNSDTFLLSKQFLLSQTLSQTIDFLQDNNPMQEKQLDLLNHQLSIPQLAELLYNNLPLEEKGTALKCITNYIYTMISELQEWPVLIMESSSIQTAFIEYNSLGFSNIVRVPKKGNWLEVFNITWDTFEYMLLQEKNIPQEQEPIKLTIRQTS